MSTACMLQYSLHTVQCEQSGASCKKPVPCRLLLPNKSEPVLYVQALWESIEHDGAGNAAMNGSTSSSGTLQDMAAAVKAVYDKGMFGSGPQQMSVGLEV